MTSKFKARALTFMVGVALSLDQAMAMGWWKPDHGHDGPGGGSGPATAPELDGPGGIAAIAILVSIALVLFNRSRDR